MWMLDSWLNETYVLVKDSFTNQEIDDLIKKASSLKKEKGTLEKGNENTKIRDSDIIWLKTDNKDYYDLYRKLGGIAIAVNNDFFHYNLTWMEDLQFTEYTEGQYYTSHKDAGYDAGYARKLTLVMQLTDPSEYEGGELLLYDNTIEKPSIADKTKGAITIFPGWIVHEVKPVTKGIRHSLVCWFNGPRFK